MKPSTMTAPVTGASWLNEAAAPFADAQGLSYCGSF